MKKRDLLDSRENNSGFIRFMAASLVLFSHAYYLLGRADQEPFIKAGITTNIGGIAVYVFFVLSGFLLTRSWFHNPNVVHFLVNRVLRILPALSICYLLMIFVVSPFITSVTLDEYFNNPMTWDYAKNMFLFAVPFRFWLPGVFENNVNQFVNGALWTIPIEFFMYLLLALMGVIGFLKIRILSIIVWFFSLVLFVLTSEYKLWSDLTVFSMQFGHIAQFTPFFLSGCMMYQYRQYFPIITKKLLVILILLISFSVWLSATTLTSLLVLPIFVISLSFVSIPKRYQILNFLGDYSYGMYIYGWFVQQLIVQFIGTNIPIVINFLLCLIFSLSLGFVSWHIIEKNVLKYKFIHT